MTHARQGLLPVIGLVWLLGGCAGPSLWLPMTQSNFDYPNSNVIPLKHVVGTSTRSYFSPFEIPRFSDATAIEEAINNALRGSGGDIMIDGSYAMESKLVPLLFFESVTVTYTVDGTAGKMEIGKRNIR